MDRLNHFLANQWLGLVLSACTLAFFLGAKRRRRGTISGIFSHLIWAGSLGLVSAGGLATFIAGETNLLAEPQSWGWWLGGLVLTILGGMVLVLLVTGHWSGRLAWFLSGLLLLALGGLIVKPASTALVEGVLTLARFEVLEPWWLVILSFIPVIFWLSFRSLAGLGPVRRWLAIGLRSALILLLTLALADVRLRYQSENVTVLFLVDRSLSIPEEHDGGPNSPTGRIDRRWERVKRFINLSVEGWAPNHKEDRAGIIVFGRRPRLELPPSNAPRLNFDEVASTIDNTYTDIGSSIKLALASFPEKTGRRIVLISDGNENLGNADEQARMARLNGVQIDVVPLAAGYKSENEVLVQAVEAPAQTEQGSQLPIRVLIRSYNPHVVVGTLTLNQITEGQPPIPVDTPRRVKIQPGLNAIAFKKTLSNRQQTYTYEAIFEPEGVLLGENQLQAGLPGDKVQNNRATTHVLALGQRRILLVEAKEGDQQLLFDRLRSLGGASKFRMDRRTADQLPQDKTDLSVFLSKYDCVILANLAASEVVEGDVGGGDHVPGVISDDQQEIIRSNTHDQGCGLIMIGGPNSFGAGGWQGTPVEKALPVDCDIKSLKIQGKGGLVLIMHASEMADGNRWQKEIAKLAIKKLQAIDEVGILYFDWGNMKWHIPLQQIGENRNSLLRKVDALAPGDMPDFDPALRMAYDALMENQRDLATRHIIIISDGDPVQTDKGLLGKMLANKVTVTTVGVATHGSPQDQALSDIARATGGRFYNVKSPKALPAIYIKETRLVSQSFLYEKENGFQPSLSSRVGGPTDKLDSVPPLYGFVRTTKKDSLLADMPIEGPPTGDLRFPILAYWHYGLGKAVAFTSDARTHEGRLGWDRDWANSEMYTKFWEQVVDWSLRAVETGRLLMTTEYHDGLIKVIVEARDLNTNKPLTNLNLRGSVTPPTPQADVPRKFELKFKQKNSGIYEAVFKAEEAGSYFVMAQATQIVQGKEKAMNIEEGVDSVRSGVTIPYSPEFAEMESNPGLLEKLRAITGGKMFADSAEALAEAASAGDVYRREGLPFSKTLQPTWYWLLVLSGILLFLDVAVRRIAIEPVAVAQAGQRLWERLRRQSPRISETPEFLDRLKTRKSQIVETLEQARATRRFEADPGAKPTTPPGASEAFPPAQTKPASGPAPQIGPGPEPEKEAGDFGSRLLKAKKRIWEERDKDK